MHIQAQAEERGSAANLVTFSCSVILNLYSQLLHYWRKCSVLNKHFFKKIVSQLHTKENSRSIF